jgi:hypothetical protein
VGPPQGQPSYGYSGNVGGGQGQPPPGHGGPPEYGPPPPGPHPAPSSGSGGGTGALIGFLFAGLAAYSALNIVIGFFVFFAAMSTPANSTPYLAIGAIALALAGLGAGIGLCFVRKTWSRGLGLGLMIGWALWSILSAGFCTGINPGLYG